MNVRRIAAAVFVGSASVAALAQTVVQTDAEKRVVQISVRRLDGSQVGAGTGFFVRDDGLIATAFHVYTSALSQIADTRSGMIVATRASRSSSVSAFTSMQLVNADVMHDLALLKLSTLDQNSWNQVGGIVIAKLSVSPTLTVGTEIHALGYFGADTLPMFLPAKLVGTTTVAVGTAGAPGLPPPSVEELLADLKAFPGQSGSPVFADDGSVIGVVDAMVPVTVQFNPQQLPTGFNRVIKVEFLQALLSSTPK